MLLLTELMAHYFSQAVFVMVFDVIHEQIH